MTSSVTPSISVAERAHRIRRRALEIAAVNLQGYIGQALGTADVMASLFFREKREADRFVLSVGHYALAVYATLAEAGQYTMDDVKTYGVDGSEIEESPLEGLPGFEATGGSLGQGLSQALGMAIGMRVRNVEGRVFCLISDGELQEGQVWEAFACAAFHRVGNLVAIVDRNHQQVDGSTDQVASLEPLGERLAAFGWRVLQVDGHNLDEIASALAVTRDVREQPTVVVATTRIGHPVPVIANARYLHYVRMRPEKWREALEALDAVAIEPVSPV